MYTRYFGLCEYPFGLTSDLRFFYPTPLHEEVCTSIATAVHDHRGLILLTGEPGTGKTTLLHRLAQTLGDSTQILWLPLAAPTFTEILSYLSEQCTLSPSPHEDTEQLIARLHAHLSSSAGYEKTVVLFIDEAQHLDLTTLQQLSQLLQLEGPRGKLLQIVLAGHPELEENLAHPEVKLLQQHLAAWQRLSPFPQESVASYIRHRLMVAGCDRPELFTPEAIRTVSLYSQAIPRLINVICDNALLTAYRLDLQMIPLEVIIQVVEDLQFSSPPARPHQQQERWLLETSVFATRTRFSVVRSLRHPIVWGSISAALFCIPLFNQPLQSLIFSLSKREINASFVAQTTLPTGASSSEERSPSKPLQSVLETFSTPASALLPSAAPVAAAVSDQQEPIMRMAEVPRSFSVDSAPSSTTAQPLRQVPPTVSNDVDRDEVARIIEILRYPIPQPTEPRAVKKTPSSTSSTKKKRPRRN